MHYLPVVFGLGAPSARPSRLYVLVRNILTPAFHVKFSELIFWFSLNSAVRYQIQHLQGQIFPGDVIMANHPQAGGR
jgi:hypothetical protein